MLRIGPMLQAGVKGTGPVISWILANGAAVGGVQYAWIDTSVWTDANVWKD